MAVIPPDTVDNKIRELLEQALEAGNQYIAAQANLDTAKEKLDDAEAAAKDARTRAARGWNVFFTALQEDGVPGIEQSYAIRAVKNWASGGIDADAICDP